MPTRRRGETTSTEEQGDRTTPNDDIQRGGGREVGQRSRREECRARTPDSSGPDIVQSDRQPDVAIRRGS